MAISVAERVRKHRAAKKAAQLASSAEVETASNHLNSASPISVKPGTLRVRKCRAAAASTKTTAFKKPALTGAERMRAFRARKKFVEEQGDRQKSHACAVRRRIALNMKAYRKRLLERQQEHDPVLKSVDAIRSALYRHNMTPELRAARLARAAANSRKHRLFRKASPIYLLSIRKKAKARMRVYRLNLSAEKKQDQASKSVVQCRLQRIKYKATYSKDSYLSCYYGGNFAFQSRQKGKARHRKYNRKRTDNTAVVRSRKRRHCNHPPCRENRMIDGMWHYGKYCQILYPGARKLYFEELCRKGKSTAVYDPDPKLVYSERWDKDKARGNHYYDGYVEPIYVLSGVDRCQVRIDYRGELSCQSEEYWEQWYERNI